MWKLLTWKWNDLLSLWFGLVVMFTFPFVGLFRYLATVLFFSFLTQVSHSVWPRTDKKLKTFFYSVPKVSTYTGLAVFESQKRRHWVISDQLPKSSNDLRPENVHPSNISLIDVLRTTQSSTTSDKSVIAACFYRQIKFDWSRYTSVRGLRPVDRLLCIRVRPVQEEFSRLLNFEYLII